MSHVEKTAQVLTGFLKVKEQFEKRNQFIVLFYSATSSKPHFVKQINMDPLGHVTFTTTVDLSKAQQFENSEVEHFKLKEKLLKLTEQFEAHNSFAIAQLDLELNLVAINWDSPLKSETNVERKLRQKIEEVNVDLKHEKNMVLKERLRLRKETYLEILRDL